MMVTASGLKPDEVEKAYDFYRKGKFFEPTGRVSLTRLKALVAALEGSRRPAARHGRQSPAAARRDKVAD